MKREIVTTKIDTSAPTAVISIRTERILMCNDAFQIKYRTKNRQSLIGKKARTILNKLCPKKKKQKESCVISRAILTNREAEECTPITLEYGKQIFLTKIAAPVKSNKEVCILYKEVNTTAPIYDEIRKKIERSILYVQAATLENLLKDILNIALSSEIPWLSSKLSGAIFVKKRKQKKLFLIACKNLAPQIEKRCREIRFGECLCGKSAAKRDIIFVDSEADCEHEITFKGMKAHGHYILPLVFDGKFLGVINYYLPEGHVRDEYEEKFLKSIAGIIAIRMNQHMTKSTAEANAALLRQKSQQITTLFNLSPVAQFVTDTSGNILRVNTAGYYLLGVPKKRPSFYNINDFLVDPKDRIKYLKEMKNLGNVKRYRIDMKKADGTKMHCLVSAGIDKNTSGRTTFNSTIEDDTERYHLEKELERQAKRDALTGLPNRALFLELLGQALKAARRSKQKIALLFADLNGFKKVNDTGGHDVGDELLRMVAVKLEKCIETETETETDKDKDNESKKLICTVRKSDTVARLGGDEFTLILANIQTEENAIMVANRIIELLNKPFIINEVRWSISVSIGIALFPDDGNCINGLVKRADTAMYYAKQNSLGYWLASSMLEIE